jgi:transposase
MAIDQKVKAGVRTKYVQGQPLATAAQLAGASYQTARNWKRNAKEAGDDWDVARAARRMSGGSMEELTGQILEEMSVQFMATLNDIKSKTDIQPAQKAEILARLSDSYVKTINAAARGNPRLSELSIAMDILRDLSTFISSSFPAMRDQFIEVIESFGPEIAKKYG